MSGVGGRTVPSETWRWGWVYLPETKINKHANTMINHFDTDKMLLNKNLMQELLVDRETFWIGLARRSAGQLAIMICRKEDA